MAALQAALLAADSRHFSSSFEETEGFLAGGSPHGWLNRGSAQVDRNTAASGGQSVRLPPASPAGLIARDFSVPRDSAEIYVDLYLRPAAGAQPEEGSFLELGMSAVGFLRDAGGLQVLAFDGNGSEGGRWATVKTTKAPDDWLRITLRHDFAQGRWDLFIDGKPARVGLGFFGLSNSRLALGVFGGTTGDTWLDSVYIGPLPPHGIELASNGDFEPAERATTPSPPDGEISRETGAIPAGLSPSPVRGPAAAKPAPGALVQNREQKLKVKLVIYSVLE